MNVSMGVCPTRTPNSPMRPGATTSSTSLSSMTPFGVTSCTLNFSAISFSRSRGGACQSLRLGINFSQIPNHVECLFGDVIQLAFDDFLEGRDRVLNLDVLTG